MWSSETRAARRLLLALLLPLALAGCGFALRGSNDLAYSALLVQGQGGPLLQLLRRTLVATTNARLVSDPKQAQAVLTLLHDSTSQTASAYNSDGTVAQFTLRERVAYALTAPDGTVLIPRTELSLSSIMSYSTGVALGKAEEADLLYQGMRRQLVDRIIFQLGNFQPPADAAAARP